MEGDWTAQRRGSSPRRPLGWILLCEKVMSVALPAECVADSSSPSSAASGLVRDCLVVSRRPRTWAIRREKSLLCCFPAWNTSSTYGKKINKKNCIWTNKYMYMQCRFVQGWQQNSIRASGAGIPSQTNGQGCKIYFKNVTSTFTTFFLAFICYSIIATFA